MSAKKYCACMLKWLEWFSEQDFSSFLPLSNAFRSISLFFAFILTFIVYILSVLRCVVVMVVAVFSAVLLLSVLLFSFFFRIYSSCTGTTTRDHHRRLNVLCMMSF